MKRVFEGAAAAAMAVTTAGPAQAVVTGHFDLMAIGAASGPSVSAGACKDVLAGDFPDQALGEDGGHARLRGVFVGERLSKCAPTSPGDDQASASIEDDTKAKMEAGERALALKVGTSASGPSYSADASGRTGIRGSFLAAAPPQASSEDVATAKTQGLKAAKIAEKEKKEAEKTEKSAKSEKSEKKDEKKKLPEPKLLPRQTAAAEAPFFGQARLTIEVDGLIGWTSPSTSVASGALRVSYGEQGGGSGVSVVELFDFRSSAPVARCGNYDAGLAWIGLQFVSGPDCAELGPDDGGGAQELLFGASTYEFLLGFEPAKVYDLHVELLLDASDGATLDFLNSAEVSLRPPTGVAFVDQAGSDVIQAIGIVPVPPAALLLLSGFGAAAVVRRRAKG